jgi:hypothetical protein
VDVNGELLDIMGECSCPVGFKCKHVAGRIICCDGQQFGRRSRTLGHGRRNRKERTRPVPALRAGGWEIEIAADSPIHLVRADGEVSAELHEGTGIDWFELDLGVLVDGERIEGTSKN